MEVRDIFMSDKTFTLKELAEIVSGTIEGNENLSVSGIGELREADDSEISFIFSEKYLPELARSKACAVIAGKGIAVDRAAIIVENPELAAARLFEIFAPPVPCPKKGIHKSAVVESDLPESVAVGANSFIGSGSRIGENTIIYPNVYIASEVDIGSDCVIWPGVAIRERITIGNRVIIHPNATIGTDGFGYIFAGGRHRKVTHIGRVHLEDDVEIGASVCIDRAKVGVTKIGEGTKIDNLVQIGHNTRIGKNSIIVAQVGIAGSADIGSYVVMGGRSGVSDHIRIGDRAKVAACSVAFKNVPAEGVVRGTPADDNHVWLRREAELRRLPKKVAELRKKIDELEEAMHNSQRNGNRR